MSRRGYDIRIIVVATAGLLFGFGGAGFWSGAGRAEQAIAARSPDAPANAGDSSPQASQPSAGTGSSETLPDFVPEHAQLDVGAPAAETEGSDAVQPAAGAAPARTITFEPDPKTAALPPAQEPSAAKPSPVAANTLFGAVKTGAPLAARAIGTYARGCLSGGIQLPVDGPEWQAMRLSRNRQWGHPKMIALVERLAKDAKTLDGWPGLLVGDIAQPRGGPMLSGHRSHQVGLDSDVWLTPMPDRKLSYREREDIAATSMLDKTDLAVDANVFTAKHVALIKRAASYPEVERIFVHPAIKKALCGAAGNDRQWLGKVRPMGGHYYHFHIRIKCPPGYAGCKSQAPPAGDDGCTKEVDEWLARLAPSKTPPPPRPPGYKPKPPPPPITLAQLPGECTTVLTSGPDGIAIPNGKKPSKSAVAISIGIKTSPSLRPHLSKNISTQTK